MRYNDLKIVETKLKEGAEARIQHAEDIIFWEGSKGALRALAALESMESGGHEDVTIKWDGSPAIIFGRNENGEFVLTDKSGFTAKGYDGKATSPEHLEKMLLGRKGEVTDNRKTFAANMKSIFDEYERAVASNFRGYFKGDLLYYRTPKKVNNRYSFKPQIVTYEVDADSALGMKIGLSKTGVVIHRYMDLNGKEVAADQNMIEKVITGNDVLAVPPQYATKGAKPDTKNLEQIKQVVKQNAGKIDELLNKEELRAKKLSGFSDILYKYVNQKVDTSLANLGADFKDWLATSKLSGPMRDRVLEHIGQHPNAWNALWKTVSGIMKIKDNIIAQLDSHDADVVQKIGTQKGGEGYVMKHPGGDIKFVPREYFTKANRAKMREEKNMRASEFVSEANIPNHFEIKPEHKPFIDMGHKIRAALEPASGIKWDDEEFNTAAELSTQLVNIGASMGPKNAAEALKKAGVDVEQAKAIMKKSASAKMGTGVADKEPEDDDDDMDRAPSDDDIARQADARARGR